MRVKILTKESTGSDAIHDVNKHKRYHWEWVDRNGKQKRYPPEVSWLFEQIQRGDIRSFYIDLGGDRVFEADLENCKQHNLKWKLGKGHATKGGRYARCSKKEPREMVRVAKKGKQAERFEPDHHWEWQDKKGKWHSYDSQVSDWLEYVNEKNLLDRCPIIDIGNDMIFKLDLNREKQISMQWKGDRHGTSDGEYVPVKPAKSRKMRREGGACPKTNNHQRVRILLKGL